ncbi:MAG: flagellar biosynthesis protein FlhB [Firmicutes bacterium HGW-Firmicutes-14]|nr:MAG: flagellar biosynthesis protein FlhB [Firmicutes bacterium HGW-Firmicutes-14]
MRDSRMINFRINLQLFAEKTEKPTAKRRSKAAEKGQVARSPEVNSVLILLVCFVTIRLMAPILVEEWTILTSDLFRMFAREDFSLDFSTLQTILLMSIIFSSKILVPIVGGALVAGLSASIVQMGFRFDMSAIAFDLKNINPVSGFKQLCSLDALARLVKSILVVILIGYVAYNEITKQLMNFTRLSDMNLRASSAFIGQVTMNVVLKVVVWLIIVAIADYAFQKWRTEKRLRMEKQEIKDEYKQTEGDPKVKAAIRRKQAQMSMMRMMQVLPKADVVITNPTHFAVALRYDAEISPAPVVIAKGQDRMAEKIREVAREHNIVIVENKPLAQSLYFGTDIGDTVPEELYQAVAEVLAFVYKLKGKI